MFFIVTAELQKIATETQNDNSNVTITKLFVSLCVNRSGLMSDITSLEDDDDEPKLSSETLAVLQEFYREQHAKIEKDKRGDISEDWQLSQFWYDDETAMTLAKEVLETSNNGRICCLCAPTLYKKLKEIKPEGCKVVLFEYDQRFSTFGKDFVFYDYNDPLNIPDSQGKSSFDVVFADPPFLSEECLSKVSKTVKYLMKDKIIICTGLRMQDMVKSLLGAKPCEFIPSHKNNLMNEFRCYTNYDSKLNVKKSCQAFP